MSDILLTGLGASLGGAGLGSFIGSYLQVYYSSKSERGKDHFLDLKENVIDPLINTASRLDFAPSAFTFSGIHYEEGEGLQSNDVLFEDFMTNHYPTIRDTMNEVVGLSLELGNREHNLSNEIRESLLNTLHGIETIQYQFVNYDAVDMLADAILHDYDDAFLRITNYATTRKLYYYYLDYPLIAFGADSKRYEIFSSALTDEQANIRSAEEVRDTLIASIHDIRHRLVNDLESNNASRTAFTNERNTLVNSLLQVRYATNLNFVKRNMHRTCPLV